jgi:L-alanine-DL-glutamate epimerase-like enolase superfamily enzyme
MFGIGPRFVDNCRKAETEIVRNPQRLTVTRRAWPLARQQMTVFGVTTAVDVVAAELSDGNSRGRGEGAPLPRFDESVDSVIAALDAMKGAVAAGLDRDLLLSALPPGAARNALDCAFWAIEANRAYHGVAELAGLGSVPPVITAFTIGFDTPERMAEQAAAHRARPLLRLELGGDGDVERVQAVRQAVPASRLIVDAAEGWTEAQLRAFMPALVDCRVDLIEQPLPAGADGALAGVAHAIRLCADESCRTVADLDRLDGKYAAVAIKLDKVGGLTEALAMAESWMRTLKREEVDGQAYRDLAAATASIGAFIEEVYNRQRLHSALAYRGAGGL